MIFFNVNINNLGQMPKYSWWIFVTGLGLFFAIIPYFIELFVILEMSRFFGMALLALSMGFLWGYGGMLSFGQTAFFGVGGYSYSVLALNTGETTGALFFAVTAGMFIAATIDRLIS